MELHPSGFVETGQCTGCDGPRYVPIQPSRETPGILLADKYITEFDKAENMPSVDFNLPFRNSIMYTKQLKNNYDLLDQEQKNYVSNLLSDVGTITGNGKNSQKAMRNLSNEEEAIDDILDKMYSNDSMKSGMDAWVNKQFYKNPNNIVGIVFIVLLFIILGSLCGYYAKH
jgi:hypothetical protein